MNAMTTEGKTTDVVQALMFAGPSDIAGARDTICGYTTDETPEAMPQTQRSASCLCTQLDTARRKGDLGWAHTSDYVRVIVEHKETSEGAVLQEDVRPISVSARHGSDVKADQLDKDLMEYAVKSVRLVYLCTDKTSYRFGLLKVELKMENIEKNTPVLSIPGRITLHIIVNFSGIETEFESLFWTDRPTSFE